MGHVPHCQRYQRCEIASPRCSLHPHAAGVAVHVDFGELRAAGASPDALQTPNSPLTARESQIASMAAAGYANQEIADRLFITTHTVEYHLKNIYRKLGVASRTQLVAHLAKEEIDLDEGIARA